MTAYVYNKIATFCCKVTQTSHKKTVGKENKKLKNCISLGIIKPILNLLAILHILFIHAEDITRRPQKVTSSAYMYTTCILLMALQFQITYLGLVSQVSISSTFYEQLLHQYSCAKNFLCLQFGFVILQRKNIGAKAARKMLMKLSSGEELPKCTAIWEMYA